MIEFTPTDPYSPHTWSYTKRWIATLILSQIAIVVGVAASMPTAGSEQATAELGISTELYALETGIFLVGFGLASPILAPLRSVAPSNPYRPNTQAE